MMHFVGDNFIVIDFWLNLWMMVNRFRVQKTKEHGNEQNKHLNIFYARQNIINEF